MSVENNPLKQYFRRPAVFIKLPSEGKGYPEGVIDMPPTGELPVYPMTAIDEITTKTPDALFNGSAITELIKSCMPNIKDPWKIFNTDLDTILIAIKSASTGNDIELDSQCPSCENIATYTINLIQVLSTITAPNYENTLDIGDLKFKFHPLTYKQMNEASLGQFEVQRNFIDIEKEKEQTEKTRKGQEALKKVTELTMKILSETIAYIQTPNTVVDNKEYIFDFLKNCDKNIFTTIRDYNAKLKEASDIKPLQIQCSSCQHKYTQTFTLNSADFFG